VGKPNLHEYHEGFREKPQVALNPGASTRCPIEPTKKECHVARPVEVLLKRSLDNGGLGDAARGRVSRKAVGEVRRDAGIDAGSRSPS
jgi:hypothetical protein